MLHVGNCPQSQQSVSDTLESQAIIINLTWVLGKNEPSGEAKALLTMELPLQLFKTDFLVLTFKATKFPLGTLAIFHQF